MNDLLKQRTVALQIKLELASRELAESVDAVAGYLDRNTPTPGTLVGLALFVTAHELLEDANETMPRPESLSPGEQDSEPSPDEDDTTDGIAAAELAGDPGLALLFPDPWTEVIESLTDNGMTTEQAAETLLLQAEELLQLALQARARGVALLEGEFRPQTVQEDRTESNPTTA